MPIGHVESGAMAAPAPDFAPESVTELLVAWSEGDAEAFDRLVPLVHGELRRIARRQMRGERPGHTLQTTALVNEAYLRMVYLDRMRWQDRGHFFAMAARLMRRALVDYARTRHMQKRGGGLAPASFDEALEVATPLPLDVVRLDDALSVLAAAHPRPAAVVEMRYFGGFSVAEVAGALGVSVETVARDWRFARLWLLRELTPPES